MRNSTLIDPQKEFAKVEKMLCALAWKTAKTYPISFEEARSEAYWAFMEACRRYEPRRGSKFSSWVYFLTWCKLKSLVTARSKDPLTFIEIEEDLLGAAPAERAESLELIEDLSEDAREIVHLILETPEELIGMALTPRRLLKGVIHHICVRKGKSERDMDLAVSEIKTKLRQAWGQTPITA